MKHLISKDTQLRTRFNRFEHNRLILLSIYRNEKIPPSIRFMLQTKLFSLIKSSKTRIKNRCIITGRSHSVIRQFRLSRIQFRLFALNGFIPGVKKSSW